MRRLHGTAWTLLLPLLSACSVRGDDPSGAEAERASEADGTGAATAPSLPATDAGKHDDAAAPACAIAGLYDDHCMGRICTVDGDAFLWLTKDSKFDGAALVWNASICEHSLGGPHGGSRDGVSFAWALTLRELRELRSGAQVLTYYAGPTAPPTAEALACTLEIASPLPACPTELGQPRHPSLSGCRGPLDDDCAVCKVAPSDPNAGSNWRSSSGASDWYDTISSLFPATTCATECPPCAPCSYRQEESARTLPARPECLPCPADIGIDPCWDRNSCDCWCTSYAGLGEACPTVLE